MKRIFDDAIIQKDEFCFIPTLSNATDGNESMLIISPANCVEVDSNATMRIINAYGILMFL